MFSRAVDKTSGIKWIKRINGIPCLVGCKPNNNLPKNEYAILSTKLQGEEFRSIRLIQFRLVKIIIVPVPFDLNLNDQNYHLSIYLKIYTSIIIFLKKLDLCQKYAKTQYKHLTCNYKFSFWICPLFYYATSYNTNTDKFLHFINVIEDLCTALKF